MSLRQSKLYVSLQQVHHNLKHHLLHAYILIISILSAQNVRSFGPKAPLVASTSNNAKDSEKIEKPTGTQSPVSAKTDDTEDTAMEEDNEPGKPWSLAANNEQFWWQNASFSRTN